MAILIDFGPLSLACLTYAQVVVHLSVISFSLLIIYNVTMHTNFSGESGPYVWELITLHPATKQMEADYLNNTWCFRKCLSEHMISNGTHKRTFQVYTKYSFDKNM
jgi:hypothetical protein